MESGLSLPPSEELDNAMLKIARDMAQDIYPIEDILRHRGVSGRLFEAMKQHPRFRSYVLSEREAWLSAGNTEGRTKLKAGIVLETFMDNAYTEMTNRLTPLSQRVALGTMLAKIAGYGEPKVFQPVAGNGGSGNSFMLQINIGPGAQNEGVRETINITPEFSMPPIVNFSDDDDPAIPDPPAEFEEPVLDPPRDFGVNYDLGDFREIPAGAGEDY